MEGEYEMGGRPSERPERQECPARKRGEREGREEFVGRGWEDVGIAAFATSGEFHPVVQRSLFSIECGRISLNFLKERGLREGGERRISRGSRAHARYQHIGKESEGRSKNETCVDPKASIGQHIG